jgi:hypothetical protein
VEGAAAPSPNQRLPEALGKILAADIGKWGTVIRDAGIKAN